MVRYRNLRRNSNVEEYGILESFINEKSKIV